MPSLFRGGPLFLIFLVAALCGVAVVAWWPAPDVVEESQDKMAH
jgi:hypothetical protein